jgi:hypothetical protein
VGKIIYMGWFKRRSLAHFTRADGASLCSKKKYEEYSWTSGDNFYRIGCTKQQILDQGWSLCQSCDSQKHREEVSRIELEMAERSMSRKETDG